MDNGIPPNSLILEDNSPKALGAYLIGMIASFDNTRILDTDNLPFDPASLQPDKWYPFDYALAMADLIAKTLADDSSLLFWAGVRFIEIWYWHGPGKELVFSSLDWVKANQSGGGYSSVVIGELSDVGWTKSQEIDLDEGCAVIESVMPWGAEYLRGVLFGGFMLFDDLSCFNVETISVTKEEQLPFPKTLFKMTFKQKMEFIYDAELEQAACDENEKRKSYVEELLIRARHKETIYSLREQYIQEMEFLLKNSVADLKEVQKDLVSSNLQLALEATTDSLTGLNNRRYFYQRTQQLCSIAERRKYSIFLILVDIDYFKRFNDFYGHLEGDKAIAEVAQCVKSVFKRGEDIACRFGGEEFVCVSLIENEQDVFQLAEMLRQEVLKRHIAHDRSDVSGCLTISIGSATGKANEIQIEKLLEQADKALYEAKERGRNRHVHF